jgi:hypothetical protein
MNGMEEQNEDKTWHVVSQVDIPADNERVVAVARRRFDESTDQKGFAVFSKGLFDEAKPSEFRRSFYFSPGASVDCSGALISLRAEKCEKPSDDAEEGEPRLKLEVGDPATAWDLLK